MDSPVTYYQSLLKEYRRDLKHIVHEADSDTIHEVRTIIKKMRAILHLLSFSNSRQDFDHYFDPQIEIFKAAGNIRDLDIALAYVSELANDDVKSISILLQKERKKKVLEAQKIAGKFLSHTNSYKKIVSILSQITEKQAKDFLVKTLLKIEHEKRKRLSTKRLHTIRKLYKEYSYISKAARQKVEDLRHVDLLQKQIGNWHDLVIFTDIMKHWSEKVNMTGSLLRESKKEERKLKKQAVRVLFLIPK